MQELLNEIRRLCLEAKAIASENSELFQPTNDNSADMKLDAIIRSASSLPVKRNHSTYEYFKKQVAETAKTVEQYETAIQQLTTILKI